MPAEKYRGPIKAINFFKKYIPEPQQLRVLRNSRGKTIDCGNYDANLQRKDNQLMVTIHYSEGLHFECLEIIRETLKKAGLERIVRKQKRTKLT